MILAMNEKLAKLHPLFIFLSLEFLAIVSFGLGGNNVIFYIFGTILAIFGGVLTFKRFKKNELFSLLIIGVPVLLLSVFVSFGRLSWSNGVFVNIATFLGIVAFFAVGLFLRRTNKIKPELVILCIGGGLALVVLISMIATWAQYGLFYAIRYRNTPLYFYGGERFDVTKEQSWLTGFSFNAVTLRYSGFFGLLLTTGFAGMMFINPKKELHKFIISGSIGFVGFLSLITAPNWIGLLMMIPMLLVAGYIRVMMIEAIPEKVKKIIRNVTSYAFLAFVIICVILFVIIFLNASGYDLVYDGFPELSSDPNRPTPWLTKFILSNKLLSKLFNNSRFMGPINIVLGQASLSFNFFGFADIHTLTINAMYTNSTMLEIEIVKEGGIFAFVVIAFFLVFVVQNLFKYGKSSKDSPLAKGIIVTTIMTFIIYLTFNYEALPLVHHEQSFNSFFRSPIGLIFLFLVGFALYPDLGKGEVPEFEKDIQPIEKKEDLVNIDEYYFDIDTEDSNNEK